MRPIKIRAEISSNHQKPIQARRVYVSLKAFEHIMGGEQ